MPLSLDGTVERHRVTDRASWLALRQRDVTASDVGAVCGVDPYRSALRVYAEKIGALEPQADNAVMRRGRWMEPAALYALAEERPTWSVRKADVYLRAPGLRLGATPDVVALDPERAGFGNVQIKVVARRKFNTDWCGRDEEGGEVDPGTVAVPLGYQLQTITEAGLLGASWAVLAALIVGEYDADLVLTEVELHAGAWARAREAVARFWECVDAGVQPPADYALDGDTLAALNPRDNGQEIDLTADARLPILVAARDQLNATVRAATASRDRIDAELKHRLGPAEAALIGGGRRITWRTEGRARRFVPSSETRVLRITRAP